MTPSVPTDVGAVADRVRAGVVAQFDVAEGLGSVAADDGPTFPFHCTAITDGSRDIAVGTAVVFMLGFGRLGRVEAREVCPVDGREVG